MVDPFYFLTNNSADEFYLQYCDSILIYVKMVIMMLILSFLIQALLTS